MSRRPPRVPSTRTRTSSTGEVWAIIDNPNYASKTPRPLVADCHDGSPFITIRCGCGGEMHQHESVTAALPDDAEIASPCKTCGELLVFPPGYFAEAFANMRAAGWLA